MSDSRDPVVARMPFGPYIGDSVDAVAVKDPAYLSELVREAVGSPDLRADAARALATRNRLTSERRWSFTQWARRCRSACRGSGARPFGIGLALVVSALLVGRCIDASIGAADGRLREPGATGPLTGFAVGIDGGGGATPLNAPSGTAPPDYTGAGSVATSSSRTTSTRPGMTAAGHANETWPGPGAAPEDRGFAAAEGAVETDEALSGDGTSLGQGVGGPAGGSVASNTAPDTCGSRVPGTVPSQAANEWVDTFQAVEFRVVRAKDTGRVTFLNSHEPYQGYFYVAIFPADYDRFPDHPVRLFEGRCIVVQGTIETYRGAPQIVLRDPADIRLLDP